MMLSLKKKYSFRLNALTVQLRIYILEQRIGMSVSGWGGGEEETRSGTEKQCSHNLQSSHPMWWSEDNSSIFPTVNILIEARSQMAEEMIKKWKK